jgi:hypothetical protein
MTVEPAWLGSTIALVLAREPDPALIADLAQVLEAREEVLPWLVLRQHAFADDPGVSGALKQLATTGNRPSRHRPDGPILAPKALALERDAEAALHDLIATHIAGSPTAETLGAILHAHNHTLPGRPAYDFRRRIVELAPVPEPEPEAPDEP